MKYLIDPVCLNVVSDSNFKISEEVKLKYWNLAIKEFWWPDDEGSLDSVRDRIGNQIRNQIRIVLRTVLKSVNQ
jgi:hypothetical protein